MFIFPISRRIGPGLQYSNYCNLMAIPTDFDRLTERKVKNCRKKLNEGEEKLSNRKEASQKAIQAKKQGISVTLNLKHLFLELQVVLGTTSAQVSLQLYMFLNKYIEKAYLAFHTQRFGKETEGD